MRDEFGIYDRLVEVERELREARSQLSRLPTRPAIFEGGSVSSSLAISAVAIVAEAGAAAGDNFKVENPWLYTPSGEEGEEEGTWLPGEWTPNPDWVVARGSASLDHLRILDAPEVEGDEPTTPALIEVADMFLDFPIIGNKVYIVAVSDFVVDFICIRKTC